METVQNQQELLKGIKERIKDVRVAMMTTVSTDGRLHSRPMSTNTMEDDGTLWFFTKEFSEKVTEISRDNTVSLSYADPSNNTYVAVLGEAQIVHDRRKMEQLWSVFLKAWFPQGLDDPQLTLLKVRPVEAEYWDSSSSKMVVGFNILKAVVTGTEYNEGDHGKVSLEGQMRQF